MDVNSVMNTYSPNLSSILSTNPYSIYNTIDSLENYQQQNLNSTIDTSV